MVTVCPSQFATRRTLFHVLVGCGLDRKSGSAGMPRPISYAVFCLKKKILVPRVDLSHAAADPAAAAWSTSCPTYHRSLHHPLAFFFCNDPPPTEIYTLSLHDALPICRVRNRRQLNSLQNTWPYGYSMPIAVCYTQDAFSRSGWLWPVDAKGEPLKATSYMAVGFYVAKYVNKKSDMDLAAKGLGAKEWNNSLKTKLSLLPKKLFRIRMSRNFGMKMLTMTNLSTECLIQLTKLGYDATPFNQILKQNAKREMRLRLGKVTVADVLAAQPVTTNLLKFMRASIKMIGVSNLQSFIASMTQKLTLSDISDESKNYLDKAGITTACLRIKSKWTAGGK